MIARGTAAVCVTVALLLATARAPAPAAVQARAPGAFPCPGAATVPSPATLDTAAVAVACLVNAHRAVHGRRPLRTQARLTDAAVRHSRDMVRRGYFGHVTPTGVAAADRIHRAGYFHAGDDWVIGEDLAWGTGSYASPSAIVKLWMNSPPHRRVLLAKNLRYVGIGRATGRFQGNSGAAVYTADFSGRVG